MWDKIFEFVIQPMMILVMLSLLYVKVIQPWLKQRRLQKQTSSKSERNEPEDDSIDASNP